MKHFVLTRFMTHLAFFKRLLWCRLKWWSKLLLIPFFLFLITPREMLTYKLGVSKNNLSALSSLCPEQNGKKKNTHPTLPLTSTYDNYTFIIFIIAWTLVISYNLQYGSTHLHLQQKSNQQYIKTYTVCGCAGLHFPGLDAHFIRKRTANGSLLD